MQVPITPVHAFFTDQVQEATTFYGRNYWYKGGLYSSDLFSPDNDLLWTISAKHAELSAAAQQKGISVSMILDVLPLEQALSRDPDAKECCFNCRGPQRNLVIVTAWSLKDHSEETEALAGKIVKELYDLWNANVETSEDTNSGYGNYADGACKLHRAGRISD